MSNRERRTLGREEIEKILPHRGRALLLDRVEFDGEHVVGYLTVREEHCEGHFPGFSIMRGIDRIEMIALTLGVAANAQLPEGQMAYLVGIGEAKFRGMVVLGNLVRSEVKITRQTSRMIKGEGKAFVGDKVVAEVQDIVAVIGKITPQV